MTHLRVEQNTITENVTSNVIHKLYETAKAIIDAEEANDVQESLVSLKGNLLVSKAYGNEIDWLEAKFPDLHITAGARYIRFADNAVYARLSLYLGDGTGITISEITNANIFNSSNDSSTGYPYFQNNTSITSFNELGLLPQVTTIPNNAFYSASSLTSIDLSNITSLGTQTFMECASLTSVDLPASVTTVPLSCFNGCTSLSSIDLSDVTTVEGSAFYNCRALTSIDLSNCTIIGSNAFYNCSLLTSANLPSVTGMDRGVFENCSKLATVTLPNTVNTIPESLFRGCGLLTTINGAVNITSIGQGAFFNCSNLVKTFDLSNTISIAKDTFKKCAKCTFTNINNVSNFGESCMVGCTSITSLDFKDGVIIGLWPFTDNPNLTSVRFRGGGTIGMSAFQNCKGLTSIIFDGDIELGPGCFGQCSSLLSVDLSNISEQSLFISQLGSTGGQFNQCTSLVSVTLNPNITKLPGGMFSYCGSSGLSITIPSGVTEIGTECFYGTSARLTVLATTPPTVSHANTLTSVSSIKVPAGTLSAYQSAPYWSDKASVITELAS